MNIQDHGVVIATRKFGENSHIISLFTQKNGLLRGLAKGKKQNSIFQISNICEINWKARLEEQLGMLSGELLYAPYPSLMKNPLALKITNSALQLCSAFLANKDPHENLYNFLQELLKSFMNNNDDALMLQKYSYFELILLQELGFGLDLHKCAASGANDGLAYISPKSGKAVSLSHGEPYHDKLFKLPDFWHNEAMAGINEAKEALEISLYFMNKWLASHMGVEIPQARIELMR
jgi:DNA repair protein RecO (recombination protein O)